jgi:hypothetical protein
LNQNLKLKCVKKKESKKWLADWLRIFDFRFSEVIVMVMFLEPRHSISQVQQPGAGIKKKAKVSA